MHSKMLHMLLYKKGLGSADKIVESFLQFVFFFFLFVLVFVLQLCRLHNRFNGNISNKILGDESVFDIYFIICR